MSKPKDKNNKDDVLAMLNDLEKETSPPKGKRSNKGATKPSTGSSAGHTTSKEKDDEDIMGFLDSLATKSRANSGRSTPNAKSSSSYVDIRSSDLDNTSSSGGEDDKRRHSEDQPQTSNVDASPIDPLSTISSWWSRNKAGIWDSATTAVKQAEATVRNLQPEVSQSSKALEHLMSDRLSKLGINKSLIQNTLSSVLETIAPPISLHEQLKIHVFHDMVGYPSIDGIVYSVFDRVMQQVEGGGDLTMVVQKGKERHRRGSDHQEKRELGIYRGTLAEAKKLAFANIEESSKDTTTEDSKTAKVSEDDSAPLYRVSNIFLSIQPASLSQSPADNTEDTESITPTDPSTFFFIIYLYDPANKIAYSTVSQAFPSLWAEWLEGDESMFTNFDADPRDWVIDWIEEGLGLAVGTVAQSYVAKRMGVDALYKVNQEMEKVSTNQSTDQK